MQKRNWALGSMSQVVPESGSSFLRPTIGLHKCVNKSVKSWLRIGRRGVDSMGNGKGCFGAAEKKEQGVKERGH